MDDRRSFALTRAGGGRIFGRAARDFSSQRVTSARSACLSLRLKFVHKACLDEFVVVVNLRLSAWRYNMKAAEPFHNANVSATLNLKGVHAVFDPKNQTYRSIWVRTSNADLRLAQHLADIVERGLARRGVEL
jgi:hypothetical protein